MPKSVLLFRMKTKMPQRSAVHFDEPAYYSEFPILIVKGFISMPMSSYVNFARHCIFFLMSCLELLQFDDLKFIIQHIFLILFVDTGVKKAPTQLMQILNFYN